MRDIIKVTVNRFNGNFKPEDSLTAGGKEYGKNETV